MTSTTNQNRNLGVDGFSGDYNIHWNWTPARFYEAAVRNEGAEIAKGGALVVKTGKHTGRSATDKFVVRDAETENTVWWEGNASMTSEHFAALKKDFEVHIFIGSPEDAERRQKLYIEPVGVVDAAFYGNGRRNAVKT